MTMGSRTVGRTLILALMVLPVARGQEAPSDTSRTERKPGVALWVGLIPGGGQVYNRKWFKAAAILGAEIYYFGQWQESADRYGNYDNSYPRPRYRYLERRNKFAWWVVIVWVMALLDGYVDAHLDGFPPDSNDDKLGEPPTPIQESQ